MRFTAPHCEKLPPKKADFATLLYGGAQPITASRTTNNNTVDSTVLPLPELRQARQMWLETKSRAGHSPRTTTLRRDVTDKLFWFLEHTGQSECGLAQLQQFFDYCQSGHTEKNGRWGAGAKANVGRRACKPLSPATLQTYYVYLKSFFSFLVEQEYLSVSPFARLEKPLSRSDQIEPFSQAQVESLIDAARRSAYPARNVALILFMLDSGVRVSELCGLKLRDVDFSEENSLKFRVLGKGSKKRTIRLGRQASAALWKYFRQEHGIKRHTGTGRGQRMTIDGDTPVFITNHHGRHGEALTRQGVLHLIADLGRDARIGGVRCSPHTFRHTFAIQFLRKGGDIFALKAMLGHSSLHMTEKYLKVTQADTEAQHRRFSPADGWFSE